MSDTPGADEQRIRGLLLAREVGPDAAPPKPTTRPRDWLDDILDSDPTPEVPKPETKQPTPKPAPAKASKEPAPEPRKLKTPRKKKPKKRKRPRRGAPRTAWDSRPASPRQSLADAWDNTPHRLKWLAYHTTAAAAGWPLGWVTWATDTAAWYAAGHWTDLSAWVLYGLGVGVIALYRRSRHWMPAVAWAAAVPASSITLGVLLYGTGYH
ncbi:hypothetical protein ABZX85_23285 [Streptomyces sp. NPDC004539]|uniref:hypothetical protein n=1 Tax=Streptomyces sp. NPDC004539 TaxID=3154280 RepID=UPI0033AFAEE5